MSAEESQAEVEAHTMPPKSMTPEAIKKMMEELLEEKLKEFKKGSSDKDKENEMEEGASGDEEREHHQDPPTELPADQKAFVDALKSIRGDVTDRLPTYGGCLNSKEVNEWIEAITNHFELNEVPKIDKVRIAKGKLRGSALSWWNYVQGERIKNNKNLISSWEVMKAKIKAQFLPVDHEV